jgi:probable phosphoglycerate mutase
MILVRRAICSTVPRGKKKASKISECSPDRQQRLFSHFGALNLLRSSKVELIFVRHGRPEHIETSDGSPADPPLAEIGHQQAAAVARWLSEEKIDYLYSSPMRRARQTAMPLEELCGLVANVREEISEFDRDSSAYVPMEVLKEVNRPAWERFASGQMSESFRSLTTWSSGVVAALEEIVERHAGQRVGVVCHGGVINAYLAHCLKFDSDAFMKFDVDYSSVTRVLASSQGHRSVRSVNETTHFRGSPHLSIRD